MERPTGSVQTTKKGALSTRKKPYIKPNCISEPIYETLALACGKLPGQGGTCRGAPRKS
jgi:hypothetical protein